MKLRIEWINPKPEGKSMLLSEGGTVLANGLKSIANKSGFVSLADPKDKAKFIRHQEIEIPDNAQLVEKPFKMADGSFQNKPIWVF